MSSMDTDASSTLSLLSQSPTLLGDVFLLRWAVAVEEKSARQAMCLGEQDERQEIVLALQQCLWACRRPIGASLQPRESLPTDTPSVSAHPCVTASSSALAGAEETDIATIDCAAGASADKANGSADSPLRNRSDPERGLAKLAGLSTKHVHCSPGNCSHVLTETPENVEGTVVAAAAAAVASPSPPVSLDSCVAVLDALVTSHSTLAELSRTPVKARHPYEDTHQSSGAPPLSATVHRQRHVLSILSQLRSALHSVRDAYAYATHSAAATSQPASLDALLQLPPDTFPLLMWTRRGSPAWRTLSSTISPFTLWAALTDAVTFFACMQQPMADALWAAVVWMYIADARCPAAVPLANNAESEPATAHKPSLIDHHLPPLTTTATTFKSGESYSLPARIPHDAKHLLTSLASSPLVHHDPTMSSPGRRSAVRHPSPAAVSRIVRRASPSWARRPDSSSNACADAYEERWAYRDFPVSAGCTAPTVYDELFPLPTATSVFTEPRGSRGNQRVVQRGAEAVLVDGVSSLPRGMPPQRKRSDATLHRPGVDFYTGPSRRPQPL
jgi:hypothetical protein